MSTRRGKGTPSLPALEYNPFLPDVHADPYPLYHRLRREDPVHWNPPGVWLLTRYDDVAAVLRDPHLGRDPRNAAEVQALRASLAPGEPLPWQDQAPSMLFVDPPDHTRLRTLVHKAFTPSAVEQLRPRVRELVAELLDRVVGRGEMDVVDDLAYPLPVTVICELLGIPPADQARFRGWSADLVHLLDPLVAGDAADRAVHARDALREYLAGVLAARRADPRHDLLTALLAAEEQGDRLSEAELLSMCVLLLVAGHETTVNLIANGTLALLRHPRERARLAGDPTLAGRAVEELLRYDAPVQLTSRIALADLELDGRRIGRGQSLVAVLGAANRDPAQFPDPDQLDLTRGNAARHVAFGGGIHFCLGASLARLEAQVALPALFGRLPGLELAGEPVWRDTITLRGLARLPVRFPAVHPAR